MIAGYWEGDLITGSQNKSCVGTLVERTSGYLVLSKMNSKSALNVNWDLCINMNNHQNAIFHQITNFLKTPLALLGVDLKNFQFNKICHFANHPYLCKGL